MPSKSAFCYVILPVAAFAGYFAVLIALPEFTQRVLHSEHGAIEWGTALTFSLAMVAGARLVKKSRGKVPDEYRVIFAFVALAAAFVALEEISYGQKVFDWQSPEWFAQHNSKGETNLHNMFGNKPSNRLRALATAGCPIICIVLPLWLCWRSGKSKPGSWTHYLVPDTRLLTLAALTLVLTAFNKVPAIKGLATSWSGHLGELKELLWGVAALCYTRIMSERLLSASSSAVEANSSVDVSMREIRRAA